MAQGQGDCPPLSNDYAASQNFVSAIIAYGAEKVSRGLSPGRHLPLNGYVIYMWHGLVPLITTEDPLNGCEKINE